MLIKSFKAPTLKEAMANVKAELGVDAVILHTSKTKKGGILGFHSKEVVEVIAAVEPSVLLILQPVTPMNGVPGAEPGYMLELQQRALARLSDVRVIPQTHRMMDQL